MATKRFTVDAVFRGINKISKPAKSMGRSISKFTRQSNRKIARLGQNFKKLGSIMGKAVKSGVAIAAAGVVGLGAAVFGLVKQFSKLEDAEAAFTPLLGGAKKAKKLVDELNKTAASTPFQFESLAGVANQLLPVMDGNIQNTIKTLRMLGDTAGGNAQKLETITRGFTKAMLKGKVDLESLNMIAESGVPIFGELAKTMGTEVGEKFFKSISKGEVTTDQLTKTFENMTKKGGLFFKGMEIASKTTTGVISTMKDNVSLAAASIGKVLAPTVKEYAGKVTELAKNIKGWVKQNEGLIKSKVDKFLKTVVSIAKKVVEISRKLISIFRTLAKVGKQAFDFIVFLSPFLKPFIGTLLIFKGVLIAIALVTKGWAIAQGILNAVMAVNPISLIIIAIAALVAGIVILINNWDVVVNSFKTGIASIQTWFGELLNSPFITGIVAIFTGIWDVFRTGFDEAMKSIEAINQKIANIPGVKAIIDFFTNGDDKGEGAKPVTPQERLSRSIEQTENNSTLTIQDQTGTAQLSPQKKGGPKIALATSGGA